MLKPEGYRPAADPWEILHDAMERGRALEAVVIRVTWPNGAPVWELSFPEIDGIRGLVPASETGLPDRNLMPRFVGQTVRVKIKALQQQDGLLACSRSEVVSEAQKIVFEKVKEGQMLDCVVRAMLPRTATKPARLLLDVGGGVLTEVPRNHASYYTAVPLSAQFVPGQAVKAKVIRLDPQQGIIDVSVREALPEPWLQADFRRGDIVSGVVRWVGDVQDRKAGCTRKVVFVEVPPGVIGIAQYPTWTRTRSSGSSWSLRRGQSANCTVTRFDPERRVLHLKLIGRLY